MASVRTALLLLPPVSVLLVVAARCLGRVAARKLTTLARAQLACPPSFRYLCVEGEDEGAGGELRVARYRRRRRRSCGEDGEEEAVECVFCLSGIEEGEEIRELRCRHLFHRGCLDRWLQARPAATCPLCRCRLLVASSARAPPWEEEEVIMVDRYYGESDSESDSDSDMMLFMACVHSRSSWFWPS